MIEGLDYAIALLKRGAARHKFYASGDYTKGSKAVQMMHFNQMHACLSAVTLLQNKRSMILRSAKPIRRKSANAQHPQPAKCLGCTYWRHPSAGHCMRGDGDEYCVKVGTQQASA